MKEFALVLVVFVALVLGLLWMSHTFKEVGCENRWEDSGFSTKYQWAGGCKIKVDGKWLPESSYRLMEE